MAFVVFGKPDPLESAKKSKDFFDAQVEQSQREVDATRVRLEDAENIYYAITTPSFKDERNLAAAQDAFENAERAHASNVLKQAWEEQGNWKRKIKTSVDYTKKLLLGIDWRDILRGKIQ